MSKLSPIQEKAIRQAYNLLSEVNKYRLQVAIESAVATILKDAVPKEKADAVTRAIGDEVKKWEDGSDAKWWLDAILKSQQP